MFSLSSSKSGSAAAISAEKNVSVSGRGGAESTLEKMQNFRVEFGPSSKDILNFTNQLAVMIKAGISLQEAFEAIATQQKNEKFKRIIIDLKNQI